MKSKIYFLTFLFFLFLPFWQVSTLHYLQFTNLYAGEAILSWDSNSEQDLAGYKIYYNIQNPKQEFELIKNPVFDPYIKDIIPYTPNSVEIDAHLVYWGNYYSYEEVIDYIREIEIYFATATQGNVILNITYGGSIGLHVEDSLHDYTDLANRLGISWERARRIWYYYHNERREKELKEAIWFSQYDPAQHDVAMVATDAQMEGIGLFDDNFPYVETGMISEANWESESGGYTDYRKPQEVADIFSHEIGHYMGLRHACSSVSCSVCAYPDDIMSDGCRNRSHTNKFEFCSLNIIINKYMVGHPGGGMAADSYGKCNDVFSTTNCDEVSSRTNVIDGRYSGSGLNTRDGNDPWIAIDIDKNDSDLEGIGYYTTGLNKNPNKKYKFITFTWDGMLIEKDPDSSYYFVNGIGYSRSDPDAANAITAKSSVPGYEDLEFYIPCQD